MRMSNTEASHSRRRGSISQWLLGSNAAATARSATLTAAPPSSAVDSDEEDALPSIHHQRTRSMSEKLGLHKVPTNDHEAIIRGDFSS